MRYLDIAFIYFYKTNVNFINIKFILEMSLSLEGTLFLNSFKDFVEGKFAESEKMYPILTFDFPEINIMLRHQKIQELVNFLKHIKGKQSQMKLQRKRIQQINQLLSMIQSDIGPKIQTKSNELINEGKELIKQKKEKNALQKFRQSIKLKPTEQAYIYVAVTELYHNKNIKSFIENINIALNFQENKNNLFLYEGAVDNLIEYQETIIKFKSVRRVVSLGSINPKYYLELIELGLKINQNLKDYFQIIQSNCPQSIERYLSLGIIFFTLDKQQKCLDNFTRAENQIHKYLQKKKVAQFKYRQTKNPAELQKLPTFNKIDQFYYYLGRAYEKFNFNAQAVEAYQAGLKYNNKSIEIWKQILQIFQGRRGYQSQGYDFVEQIILFAENDFEIHAMVLDLLFEIGQKEVLILTAQSFLELYQNNDKYFYLAAKSYLKIKNHAKCKYLCTKCIETNAKNQEVYLLIGLLYFQQKKYDQAKSNYKKAIQLNPKQFLAHYNLALILYNSKKYNQAADSCKKALQINPIFQGSCYLLIKSLLKSGNHEQAQQNIQEILYKDSQNYEAFSFLGQINFQKQLYDESEKYFQKVLQKKPNHFQSIYKSTLIKIIRSKAIQDLQIAYEKIQNLINQDSSKIKYISLFGYILIKTNRFEQAYKILISGINNNKDYYQTYFHLGYLYKKNARQLQYHAEQTQQFIQDDCQNLHYVSLFYLGLEDYQNFLVKFNQYINYYKQRIINHSQNKKEIHQVYRNVIGNYEELIKLYPQSLDLPIILGILYRDTNNATKSYEYCKKLIKGEQLLSSNFIKFYNLNHNHHLERNYIQFIYEFIFHELFNHSPVEGMKFYKYLKEVNYVFDKNQDINHVINKKKQEIVGNNIQQVAKIIKQVFTIIQKKKSSQNLSNLILNSNSEQLMHQFSKPLARLKKILTLSEYQQSVIVSKMQDILQIISQSEEISKQKSFALLQLQKEKISAQLLLDSSQEFVYRVIRFLVLKYFYVHAYPFIQSWEKLFLSELLDKFPPYSSYQEIQNNIKAIKDIVKSKLIKNESVTKQVHNLSLSSQILFQEFQLEENMIPILQINKKEKYKILPSIDFKKEKKYKGQKYLNTFQKQIIKQRTGYRSLINVSNRSSISISRNPSSIMNTQQFDWPE